MQPFFSEKRELKDKELGRNPEKKISEAREQLLKYASLGGCDKSKVFVFLPTFVHVDRKKYNDSVDNYRKTFAKNSTLKEENLIVLSNNTSLNLTFNNAKKTYKPSNDFENFIKILKKM